MATVAVVEKSTMATSDPVLLSVLMNAVRALRTVCVAPALAIEPERSTMTIIRIPHEPDIVGLSTAPGATARRCRDLLAALGQHERPVVALDVGGAVGRREVDLAGCEHDRSPGVALRARAGTSVTDSSLGVAASSPLGGSVGSHASVALVPRPRGAHRRRRRRW